MPNADFQLDNLNKKVIQKMSWILKRFSFRNKKYVTEKVRDVSPSKYAGIMPDITSDVAILLQGPIIEKDQFTFETISLYRKNFPKAEIILSTWESDRKKTKNFENLDLKIIFGTPKYADFGYGATNLQILSSQNGLKYIKERNIKYTLKSRTDQRFSNPEMLIFLKSMLNIFPLHNSEGLYQKERLIGISFNSFVYRLYGLSDMFLFGTTEDVFNYWNCQFDMRDFGKIKQNHSTKRNYSLGRFCEIYFMTEFLKSRGVELNWTLRQSWDEYAKRFLIVDGTTLDLFWPKYSFYEDRWNSDDIKLKDKEFSFSFWLRIFYNQAICDESILDIKN